MTLQQLWSHQLRTAAWGRARHPKCGAAVAPIRVMRLSHSSISQKHLWPLPDPR